MTIKYKNPPINELAIGVYFDRDVASLRSEYVGVFWNRYRRDFPIITEQQPIPPPVNLFFANLPSIQFSSMPRYWLESGDGTTIIQIQRNAFLTNWRRRNAEYPHFDTVKDFFDTTFQNFVTFLDTELNEPSPRINLAELNYINLIEPGEYWSSLLDTPKVLPRFSLPVPTSNDFGSANFIQVTIDKFEPDLTLQTTVRSGGTVNDPVKPILIFELRAVGLVTDTESTNHWFRRAHELTGRRFTEMTDPDIRTKYWQPE